MEMECRASSLPWFSRTCMDADERRLGSRGGLFGADMEFEIREPAGGQRAALLTF